MSNVLTGRPNLNMNFDEVQPELARRAGTAAPGRARAPCARMLLELRRHRLVDLRDATARPPACTFFTVWKSVSPRKRRCPASSSQRMMPDREDVGPRVDLLPHRRLGRRGSENLPLMMPGSLFSSWLLAFARPKSTIFTSPYFVMSTLGGDMSRWTMWSGDAVRVASARGRRRGPCRSRARCRRAASTGKSRPVFLM